MGDVENWHWTDTPRWATMRAMSTTTPVSADSQLEALAAGVRSAIATHGDWSHTAQLVADQLRAHLPNTDVLTPKQRQGSPDRAAGHTLHVEPDGSFSITAVVWRPGQFTRIHDHTTWCVFGVIQGLEHEDVYDADLNLIGSSDGILGDVNGFAPPGDIHRVHNTGDEIAISIHIYGTDVTRVGSSVRRYYN
jgi:predicted metal-dependent enzyme (double-stranded beta helix superfamily)